MKYLAAPDIDAVVLATPHSQHEAQALAAIAANKHVFVEKPLTLDLDSALAVAAAARQARLVLAVGFARRFHPSIAELRARAHDGRLGDVVAMVAQHTTSTVQFIAPDNWRASPAEAPGGAFTAVGVHSLDNMIEFAGRVRDVRSITARNYPGPSDDTTTVMLRFDNGATGLIFCSVATATNFELTTYGTKGLVEISRTDLSHFRFAPTATAAPTGPVPAPPDEILQFAGFDMLRAEMTRVCARDPRRHALSGADCRRAARYGGIRRHRGVVATRRNRCRSQLISQWRAHGVLISDATLCILLRLSAACHNRPGTVLRSRGVAAK